VVLREGGDVAIFAYGPVMLPEALKAAEALAGSGIAAKVIHMPWLNLVEIEWLTEQIAGVRSIHVVEDHATRGGLGEFLVATLAEHGALGGRGFKIHGVDGIPAWGTPAEALRAHGLDGGSLAGSIRLQHKPANSTSTHE
jgi:transketolase